MRSDFCYLCCRCIQLMLKQKGEGGSLGLYCIVIMFYQDHLFLESFQHFEKAGRLSINKEELYSPWTEELQNYRKVPLRKSTQGKAKSTRKYGTDFEGPGGNDKEKMKAIPQRESILQEKSVTIEYETTPRSNFRRDSKSPPKIKLPAITFKKIGQESPSNKRMISQDVNEYKRHLRNSCRRYVPKIHTESPPHLQIYKRSLVAAREQIRRNSSNLERSSELFRVA